MPLPEAPRIFAPCEPLFGSAVSSYQVEGNSDGSRKSDWDSLVSETPGIMNPDDLGPDWWSGKWRQDIEAMHKLGLTVQRFNPEWARIMPEKGKVDEKAVRFYRGMVEFLYAHEMYPMVTVSHFVLPQWVSQEGGWERSSVKSSFKYFTELLTDRFGDVPYWVTLNEPANTIALGYIAGHWPPMKTNIRSAFHAVRNLVDAHDIAYTTIKKSIPDAMVGMANAVIWIRPETGTLPDKLYAGFANRLYNTQFMHETRDTVDFIGMNFYTGYYLQFDPRRRSIVVSQNQDGQLEISGIPLGRKIDPKTPVCDADWPIVPEFFLEAIEYMYKTFNKPIVITENGIADRHDKYRSLYLLTHLITVHEAQQRGIPIPLYIHWSTVDNQEWLDGYRSRFGLISLDPKTGKRNLRRSAQLYGEIASSRTIDVARLAEVYLSPEEREFASRFLATIDKSAQS